MSSTRLVRARRLVSVVAATFVIVGLTTTGAGDVLPVGSVPAAEAAAAPAPKASLKSSATTFGTGTPVTLTAKTNVTSKAKKVVLQSHTAGAAWKTRATKSVPAKSTSTAFRLTPPASTVAYRVVVTTKIGKKSRKATSRTVTLHWKKPAVSVSSAPKKYLPGKKLTVTGTAARTPAATKVRLQRKVGSRWNTVKTVTTKRPNSPFTLTWVTPLKEASVTLRVTTVESRYAPAAATTSWTSTKGSAAAVSASLSRTTYLKGQSTTVSGKVAKVGTKARVLLQEKKGSSWTDLTSTRTTSTAGAYRFSVKETSGNHTFRVVAPETKKTVTSTSAPRTLTHATCSAASAPSALSAFFTDSAHLDGSGISMNLARVVCAAAPKSTVSVSLFILRDQDSQAKRILDALRYVHAERGVTVRFILETTYGGTPVSVANAVRSFASVTTCDQGCSNARKVGAHEHDKLLAISDMTWKSRVDPVVVLGSANWSNRQLNEYWQSATMFYDDATMYRDQVQRFERMRTCAAGKCSTIKTVGGRAWTMSSAGNWGIAGDPVLNGSSGSGVSYQFFPSLSGNDDMVHNLRTMTCSKGGSIHVAMYLTTPHRAKKIGTELGRLRKQGCVLKILVGQGSATPTPQASIDAFTKYAGVAPQCVRLMHVKFTVLQGVTRGGKTGQTTIVDGSQNWSSSGLVKNDETVFTLATDTASASRAAQIKALAGRYVTQWSSIQKHVQKCGTIAP